MNHTVTVCAKHSKVCCYIIIDNHSFLKLTQGFKVMSFNIIPT